MVCLLEQGVDTAACLGTALKGRKQKSSNREGTEEKEQKRGNSREGAEEKKQKGVAGTAASAIGVGVSQCLF